MQWLNIHGNKPRGRYRHLGRMLQSAWMHGLPWKFDTSGRIFLLKRGQGNVTSEDELVITEQLHSLCFPSLLYTVHVQTFPCTFKLPVLVFLVVYSIFASTHCFLGAKMFSLIKDQQSKVCTCTFNMLMLLCYKSAKGKLGC